jgi:hypothetical protein
MWFSGKGKVPLIHEIGHLLQIDLGHLGTTIGMIKIVVGQDLSPGMSTGIEGQILGHLPTYQGLQVMVTEATTVTIGKIEMRPTTITDDQTIMTDNKGHQ